ncbi:MAG TPA: hypothetical protein VI540_10565 [Gaiellaceae bacterium]|nr:hypothetical protein [Gaiellaceae bacterium]
MARRRRITIFDTAAFARTRVEVVNATKIHERMPAATGQGTRR